MLKLKLFSLAIFIILFASPYFSSASPIYVSVSCYGDATTDYVLSASAYNTSNSSTYTWFVLKNGNPIYVVNTSNRSFTYRLDLNASGNGSGTYDLQVIYPYGNITVTDRGSAGLLSLPDPDFTIAGSSAINFTHCISQTDSIQIMPTSSAHTFSMLYIYNTTNFNDVKGTLVESSYTFGSGAHYIQNNHLQGGHYYYLELKVTDNVQCEKTNTKDKYIYQNPGCRIGSVEAMDQFRIYPNPVEQELSLDGDLQLIQEAFLNNSFGEKVKSIDLSSMGKIDMSSIPTGIYVLSIKQKDGSVVNKKIIKK